MMNMQSHEPSKLSSLKINGIRSVDTYQARTVVWFRPLRIGNPIQA